MKTVAIVSTSGGAGRTTLTAELASLLAARKHPALALECDPRNVLGFHFGMREIPDDGLGAYLDAATAAAWARAGQRSDDDVLFVPWGSRAGPAPANAAAIAAAIAVANAAAIASPDWLRRLLAQVDMPAHGVALIDSTPWPSPYANQAISAADLVLVLAPAQPETCLTMQRLVDALAAHGKTVRYVATRLQPARQLHVDIVALLQAMLGEAMLPYHIHEDSSVGEALARSESFCRSTPHSQAAHDMNGLASWLSAWIDGAAQEPRS
ncbi:cellulose biosynthesis protein BcsQ [Cupriavidus sp. BIS7]|uniref:cellulose biosynthesis protein BcsQ n=1 Tax=Cupriavidus sp. BIS7 TaxID=1217718 RepID=UPI0002E28A2B|nr:cellulose biosynthesis protein BcsQ [Cupriavidus sp. BIS7]